MKPRAADFFIGLDPGQRLDFSALAVVERLPGPLPSYHLRHLERLNLNTPYPAVAVRARDLVAVTALRGTTKLVMDATGVGVPVLDLLRAQGLHPAAITITGGHSTSGTPEHLYVPKRKLISNLLGLFKSGRLIIGVGIPLAAELIEELQNFQVRIHGRTRQESYGAKGRHQHDDLVLALALAVFYAERF
jgi:hypothetical protein